MIEFNEIHVENSIKQKTIDEINKIKHIIANKNGMLIQIHKKSSKFIDLHYAICFQLNSWRSYPNNSIQGAKQIYEFYIQKIQKNQKNQKTPKIQEGYHEIECLLSKRIFSSEGYPKTTQYLVKWKGYDEKYNQWCNKSDITRYAIKEYEKDIDSSIPIPTQEFHNENYGKIIQKDKLDYYITFNNDTPQKIADRLEIDLNLLIEVNKDTYPSLRKTTRFKPGTNVFVPIIPINHNSSKIQTNIDIEESERILRFPRLAHKNNKIIFSSAILDENGNRVADSKQIGMFSFDKITSRFEAMKI